MKLVYIIGSYPVLTTTFIDREIQLLRAWGISLLIIAIRQPQTALSPEQEALRKDVSYMLPLNVMSFLRGHLHFLLRKPAVYFSLLFSLIKRPHPHAQDIWKTVLHFLEGVYAAHLIRQDACDHIHAHFADRAATVALVASRLLDISYSLTAHAADIFVHPVLLSEKISNASFVATCTAYNRTHLTTLVGEAVQPKIKCIYHGLDTSHYQGFQQPASELIRILAVGQLKEKKGFQYLIQACRSLKDLGYDFECGIIGEGPLHQALDEQIRTLKLEGNVTLYGALPHQEVIQKYRQASIFVLPSVLGADGDRDGIPNVILEALAMQLPVISTAHSGIPEVIQNGVNGLLVSPTDAPALASALVRLIDNPGLRRTLGATGRQVVLDRFDLERNVRCLFQEFQRSIEAA